LATKLNFLSSKFVVFSTVFWVICNLLSIYFLGEEDSRWFRVGSSLYFLIWSFFFGVFNSKMHFVLLSYLICDISLVFYESQAFNFITFISRSLIFLLLILIVFPRIRSVKFRFFELIMGAAVILVNIYLLFELIGMVPEAYLYDFFYPAYLSLTTLTMLLVGVAFTYNNRSSSKKSFYFLLAALFLALSDVNFFIAFYLDVPVFNYPDRFFHVLALGLIVLFWIKPLEADFKKLEQREV